MMRLIPRVRSLWRNVVHQRRVEQDLDDELAAVFELLVEEKVRSGMSPPDARRAARLELGQVDAVKDYVRDVRAGAAFDGLVQDVRYGVRMLARNPLFTLTATLSLAVCLGVNTAIFSLVNKLLFLDPPGVIEPERLVDIAPTWDGRFREPFLHPTLISALRTRATQLEVFGYALELQPLSLRGPGGAERIFGGFVTTNYFDVLGVRPAAGRLLGRDDSESPGASPLVVLSHAFWMRRFESDHSVVGRSLQINGHSLTVVGVAAGEFRGTSFFSLPDLWLPSSMASVLKERGSMPLAAGGRLRAGTSIAQADAEVNTVAAAVQRKFPPRYAPPPPGVSDIRSTGLRAVAASPLPPVIRTLAAGVLVLLMGLVGLVLAIACANVAGVLLARGAARRREIAVRLAIGAGRARLVRQLLTETVLLFIVGGAAGMVLARVMASLMTLALPALPVPVDVSLPLDGRVLLFTGGLSLISAMLAGVLPAMQSSKAGVMPALNADVQGPSDRMRLRSLFVVGQVAISIALLVAAGLFVGALQRTSAVDAGFDPDGVEATALDLSLAGYTDETGPVFVQRLVERARALARVTDASITILHGAQLRFCCGITVPGAEPPDGQEFFQPAWNVVEPGYFRTLRIPLLSGRDFNESDRRNTEPVAVVSEAAARQFWPGENAVGKYVLWQQTPGRSSVGAPILYGPEGPVRRDPVRLSVVGVVGNVRSGSGSAPATIYLPFQQKYQPNVAVVTRSSDGAARANEMRALVASLDPNLPVLSSVALADQISPVTFQLRLAAGVSAAVGLIGVLLAAIGVYGVTAYAVTTRTREIGVRIALGAQRRDIISLVLRHGMILVCIGALTGLGLAAVVARLLAHNRFRIPAMDPFTFAGAAVLFCGIGLVACYVPTRRAIRINPVEALRYE